MGGVNGLPELERLRGHRVEVIRVEDVPRLGYVWLRRLAASDAELIVNGDPESGLKTIALSLSDEVGNRLFSRRNLTEGVAFVEDWTAEMIEAVNPALAELNNIELGSDPVDAARSD